MAQQKQQQKKRELPAPAQNGSQKDHKAHAKDSAQVLKRAVQSSGLNGARIVAKKLDEQGRDGTATLAKLMTRHQEPMEGTDKLEWVAGPASWMREAMAADERRKLMDPASWRLTNGGLTNPDPWTPGKCQKPTHLVTGRALSRKMRRLRQKQLEMKKAQTQQPPTPPTH